MFVCEFEINTIRKIKVTFFGIIIKYIIIASPEKKHACPRF